MIFLANMSLQSHREASTHMDNLQRSTHFNQQNDPVSLEGMDDLLEGLLDKVFDTEHDTSSNVRVLKLKDSKHEVDTEDSDVSIDDLFEPDDIVSSGSGLFSPSYGPSAKSDTPSLFEADQSQTVELELKIRFLESQLDYRNKELRESFNRLRFLEGQILAKDEQLSMVPQLIERGAQATEYEYELENLKDKLELVQEDLEDTKKVMERLKDNWLGKLSLWLTKEEPRAEVD